MRFLTAYLSVTPGSRIITGTQRMQQRPIRILVDSLRLLGAKSITPDKKDPTSAHHGDGVARR